MQIQIFRALLLAATWLLYFAFVAFPANAQVFDEQFETWPTDLRIRGTVLVTNGQRSEKLTNTFFVAAGRGNSDIVNLVLVGGISLPKPEFGEDSDFQLTQIQVGERETSMADDQVQQIKAASGVWISAGEKITTANTKLLNSIRPLLQQLSNSEKVVCLEGAAASLAGKTVVLAFVNQLHFEPGLDLVPGTVVLAGFDDQAQQQLLTTIHDDRDLVGIGIDRDTAIVLRGRKISVLGSQSSHFYLAGNQREPVKSKTVREAPGRRANPYEFLVDLTAWRRQAIDRQLPAFPPPAPRSAKIDDGALYIVGGGGLPKGTMEQFVNDAGGEEAHLIYVPCTERETISREPRLLSQWRDMGVQSAQMLHTKDRNRANLEEEF